MWSGCGPQTSDDGFIHAPQTSDHKHPTMGSLMQGERENEGVCRCGVDADHKHPTMGALMLLLSFPLLHPLILCGVVSTNDQPWAVSLSFSHSLSLTLSRSLALLLSCSLARSLSHSLSCCVHKRPTIGSLSRSFSFSLPVPLTRLLSRSLALSLSVVCGPQTSDDGFSQSVTFTLSLSLTHSLWYRVHKRPTMGSFSPSLSHVPIQGG